MFPELALLLVLFSANAAAAAPFDHALTGFLLDGAHRELRCESCHANGQFRGTPRECATCHSPGNRMAATFKPPRHLASAEPCQACHRTAAWRPASYSHAAASPGRCASCHNGVAAAGKPAGHIATTTSCDACHRTSAWRPASFSHVNVAPGTCASCHNGATATGKPATHLPTTASCDACHRTTAWKPASFSHANVAPGTCASCHNGATATGKPAGHFVTTRSCDSCHRTTAWTPATAYSHLSPAYKQHAAGVACRACHTTNNEVIAWRFSAYRPDCAGCHANRFQPGEHLKVQRPQILYTVSELRDCSGSCHVYADATLTRIVRTRSGQHRPTGSF
jgi:hypothetical protein